MLLFAHAIAGEEALASGLTTLLGGTLIFTLMMMMRT